jgi:dolichol kinase
MIGAVIEDFLWLILAAGLMPLCYGDWQAWMLLIESIICFFFVVDPTKVDFSFISSSSPPLIVKRSSSSSSSSSNSTIQMKHHQRQQQRWRNSLQSMGVQMSIVLVPALLQAMAIHIENKNSNNDHDYSQLWKKYNKLVTILTIPQMSISFVLCAITVFIDPTLLVIDIPTTRTETATAIPITLLFLIVWFLFRPMIIPKNITKSFTFGELRVVSLLLLVVVMEYLRRMTTTISTSINESTTTNYNTTATTTATSSSPTTTISSLYSLVALSGSVSCCVFAYLGSRSYCNRKKILSWWWRLGLNVVGPLVVVERSLYSYYYTTISSLSSYRYCLPLSLQWLIEFLLENENGHQRIWGILYWVIILVIASYPTYQLLSLQPSTTESANNKNKNKQSVVVTRKWFHLIAVLLFGPITWQFPQLMSLSYAIATCILIVLETLRSDDAPLLQSFYFAFLDDKKDKGEYIIISHVFLIVGCAIPLWINQVLSSTNDDDADFSSSSSSLLLAEFGVISIGVGDAMGAVIGKSMGKHHWGMNQRTLEGSLAMWLSMIGIGMLVCTSMQEYGALLLATTFTTILEAFTVQLDNLVLPISGSTIILLILAYS